MTIGELINKALADEKSLGAAQVALQAANLALTTAQDTVQASDAALGRGLSMTGPVFVVQGDGLAFIYQADGAGGYTVTTAKPAETPVDTSSAQSSVR